MWGDNLNILYLDSDGFNGACRVDNDNDFFASKVFTLILISVGDDGISESPTQVRVCLCNESLSKIGWHNVRGS